MVIKIEGTLEELAPALAALQRAALAPPAPVGPADPQAGPAATPPAATPPAATPPAGAVELDSQGLPWDERINVASRTKLVKDQTWKVKRGLEQAFVETVRAELRNATPPPPPAPAMTFPQILAAITNTINAGELIAADVDARLVALGIQGGPPMIGTQPPLFPTIVAEFGLSC